eukprot:CAMPEP_0116865202 /NCGR_PEP_ID=MMETSP0418-20121206/25266_1 /TAXON_ID=1158023 /ORGANISM="Astrosyne radiata, Strain 13vi08-1A" /LENGTH=574 /DNA_ID=CAMNT_0004500547 /DNA_START=44 /DNA_END=1769 /DNA_ORIENTATION=-
MTETWGEVGIENDTKNGCWTEWRCRVPSGYLVPLAVLSMTAGVFAWSTGSDTHQGDLSWHSRSLADNDYEMLFPLSPRDVAGFTVACVGLILAAGGGIGGGGILVPTYILILGFDARYAIPLSNVTVFGGAVANTLLNMSKRHPLADRPLIDWDMEPMTIAGALIGANLNKLLPEYIIVVLLLVVLAFTAFKTLKKAGQLYHKEQFDALNGEEEDEDEDDVELGNIQTSRTLPRRNSDPKLNTACTMPKAEGLRRSKSLPYALDALGNTNESGTDLELWVDEPQDLGEITKETLHQLEELEERKKELRLPLGKWRSKKYSHLAVQESMEDTECSVLSGILERERRVPWRNVLVIFILFLVVLTVNILKGGGAFPSPIGIRCGSPSFWISEGLLMLAILAVTYHSRSYLLNAASQKRVTKYKFVEGDIQWDARSTVIYPLLCFFAGFVAGLFGIGGGIVKGPVMLALGVHPAVASATSACMILFTSFTATTSFLVFGLVIPDYAIFCLIMGFIATVVGQTVMAYLIRKYRRHSYIAYCIGVVVGISAVCMALESILSLLAGSALRSSGLCTSHLD